MVPDYEKMYFQLAAKVSEAVNILVEAQQQGENEYAENETPTYLPSDLDLMESNKIQKRD